MAQVTITINYREYAISCEDGEEAHIVKLSRLLNEKANSLIQALGPINENLLLAMVGLLVADELSETKKTLSSIPATSTSITEPAPSITTNTGISKEDLQILDTELAQNLNSLTDSIKSIALKLKSI